MRYRGDRVFSNAKGLWGRIKRYRGVYLMFLPSLIFLAIFCYSPLYGLTIAFKDFGIFTGIKDSPWVGFFHFKMIFQDPKFYMVLKNTLWISFLRLAVCMPVPIVFALLLNEIKNGIFKKTVQAVNYFPYFLSWVVFYGVVYSFTGPNGMINQVLNGMGLNPVDLTTNQNAFIPLILVSDMIKNTGWGSIIYMAAIAGIDPQLYEAVAMDGGGKLRQMWHVTLPGIRGVICFQYCMFIANILSAGFEQIYMFLNPTLYNVGDILDTYIYRTGLISSNYEISTAVGMMKGLVGMILIVAANKVCRRIGEKSLW